MPSKRTPPITPYRFHEPTLSPKMNLYRDPNVLIEMKTKANYIEVKMRQLREDFNLIDELEKEIQKTRPNYHIDPRLRQLIDEVKIYIEKMRKEFAQCFQVLREDHKVATSNGICIEKLKEIIDHIDPIPSRIGDMIMHMRLILREIEESQPKTLEEQVYEMKAKGLSTPQRYILENSLKSSVKRYLNNLGLDPESRENLRTATREAQEKLQNEEHEIASAKTLLPPLPPAPTRNQSYTGPTQIAPSPSQNGYNGPTQIAPSPSQNGYNGPTQITSSQNSYSGPYRGSPGY